MLNGEFMDNNLHIPAPSFAHQLTDILFFIIILRIYIHSTAKTVVLFDHFFSAKIHFIRNQERLFFVFFSSCYYETSPPPPIVPVQIPEIYGLAEVADFDIRAAVEVGDGAGDLEDAVVGTCRETETVHGLLQ